MSTCNRNWKYCYCYIQKWQTNETRPMRHMWKTKTQFIERYATGGSFLNNLGNKLPFETHLPGHNFTGPGTKLYKRLNPDGTPKKWGIPTNRVVNAACHHDLCYSKYDDTKTRNEVCDKTMLVELSGIVNPTLRDKIDKSIVGKLIKAKANFGLGHPIKKNWNLLMGLQRKFINQSIENVKEGESTWTASMKFGLLI